ncbi:MAG: hypothetical protein ACRC46_09870 [Thermoguttaceae bacterium]
MSHTSFFARLVIVLTMVASTLTALGQEVSVSTAVFPFFPRNQQGYPMLTYFSTSLGLLQQGHFIEAKESLANNLRYARKVTTQNGDREPWIDSICYLAQSAECDFQLGRYDDAQRGFRDALQVYMRYYDWLTYVEFTGNVRAVPRPIVPWGASKRGGAIADFSQNSFTIRVDDGPSVLSGGGQTALQSQTSLQVINAPEIVRCIALSIKRLGDILGPLAKFDPGLRSLEEVLAARPCVPNHFSETWVAILDGLALAALGQDVAATDMLTTNLVMAGSYDHDLTGYALESLAEIALRNGREVEALPLFLEATYHAFLYGDVILLDETLRDAAAVGRFLEPNKPVPFVAGALAFCQSSKRTSPILMTTLLLESAEDVLVAGGDTKLVATMLKTVAATTTKSMVAAGSVASRADYLAAWMGYAAAWQLITDGKDFRLGDADAKVNSSLALTQRRSLTLYQLGNLVARCRSGQLSDQTLSTRQASDLLAFYLREPTARDWGMNPRETLAISMAITPEPFEQWFLLAMRRTMPEAALEISELARRQRFYSSIPGGARLFSLRVLTGVPDEELTDSVRQQRRELALDVGAFARLTSQVADVKRQLVGAPAVPSGEAQRTQQRELLGKLEFLSAQQEVMLRILSLSRRATPMPFPPVVRLEYLREQMNDDTAILSFFDCAGTLFGFLLEKRQLSNWEVKTELRGPSLAKLITDYLEALGMRATNRPLTPADLSSTTWRTAGNALLQRLLGGERKASFSQLVIVPTGPLWYVPFEAMCLGPPDNLVPLLAASEKPLLIRYSPTIPLALPPPTPRPALAETVVIEGKLNPKDSPDVTLSAIERYRDSGVRNMALVPTDSKSDRFFPLPASPTTWLTQVSALVVFDDLASRGGPYEWSPFAFDTAARGRLIDSWFQLPWGTPWLVVLPSFKTPAEVSLKGVAAARLGDDIFLPAMEMMAMGTRTLLISRWRTSGRSVYDIVGAFLRELPTKTAAEAWRSAILEVGAGELVVAEEPRLKVALDAKDAIPANHPFFWSSMILLDRGQ